MCAVQNVTWVPFTEPPLIWTFDPAPARRYLHEPFVPDECMWSEGRQPNPRASFVAQAPWPHCAGAVESPRAAHGAHRTVRAR